MVTENDQHIEEAEADRWHHEQIHRGDAGCVAARKGLRGLARRPAASRHGGTPAAALAIGGVAAFCLMFATVGLRPDVPGGAHLSFIAVKLPFTLSLIGVGAALLIRSMHPGRDARKAIAFIPVPFVAIVLTGLIALALGGPAGWGRMVLGSGWAGCLACTPLFALIPFAALIWALRRAAPTNLKRAGAIAGVVAGALGAAVYAFHCPDDSVPFIAILYGAPIALFAFIGAKLGPRLLRW
jgi:hypothetical protein